MFIHYIDNLAHVKNTLKKIQATIALQCDHTWTLLISGFKSIEQMHIFSKLSWWRFSILGLVTQTNDTNKKIIKTKFVNC